MSLGSVFTCSDNDTKSNLLQIKNVPFLKNLFENKPTAFIKCANNHVRFLHPSFLGFLFYFPSTEISSYT